jgi:hypothetical protein
VASFFLEMRAVSPEHKNRYANLIPCAVSAWEFTKIEQFRVGGRLQSGEERANEREDDMAPSTLPLSKGLKYHD